MNKYGFKTFVSVTLPRPATPKRPFDKFKDLKASTSGLWAYATTTRKIASRRTERTVPILFVGYIPNSGLAQVIVDHTRYATVSLDRIFTAEERPHADAA